MTRRRDPGNVGVGGWEGLTCWIFRLVLATYPRQFRQTHGQALFETFQDQIHAVRRRHGTLGVAWTVIAEYWALVVNGLRCRLTHGRGVSPDAGTLRTGWNRNSGGKRTGFTDALWLDVRIALRNFSRRPLLAIGIVTLLATGIGANTAIFSLLNAYLLRSLPFPEAERLVSVRTAPPGASRAVRTTVPEGLFDLDWPLRDEVIEDLLTWDLDVFTLTSDGHPEVVPGAWVPPGYFRALRTVPAVGRVFVEADGQAGAAPVAVISHDLWQRRFGGDPDVIGRTVTAYTSDRPTDGEAFTVIGVLPDDFWFVNRYTGIFANLSDQRMPYMLRLRPGVTPEQAAAHLTGIARARLDAVDPEWPGMYVVATHAAHVREVRPILLVLFAAVGLVLLIACGNVAMLLTVRAFDRQHELAVQRALGASRWRVARQLGTEGILLAIGGGASGILFGSWLLSLLSPLVETQLRTTVPGGVAAIELDPTVVAFALGLSGLAGFVVAIAPAVVATGASVTASLNESGKSGSDTRKRQWTRGAVIAGEVALSLVLLIGASLMLRSAVHLHRVDLGFDPEQVLALNVNLHQRTYEQSEQLTGFVDRFVEGVRGVPGVSSASIMSGWPFQERRADELVAEGAPRDEASPSLGVAYVVTPGHFETLAIPVTRGRAFRTTDDAQAEPVAIVSEKMANVLWPGRDPLGKRLHLDQEDAQAPWRTVIGVVGDVRETLTGEVLPDVYIPYAQEPNYFLYVMAKLAVEPSLVVPAIRQALWDLDPAAAVTTADTMTDLVASQRMRPQFLAVMLTAFGVFAATLALTGLYSIVSYAVSQRRREVAIRMALGATDRSVTRLFLRQALLVSVIGAGIGVAVSTALTRALSSQLYGVTSTDLPTYVTAAAVLVGAALVAVWFPARRATGIDPMPVLRQS